MNVLDMSDPTQPVLTATLLTPAMHSPHESLVLSQERGLPGGGARATRRPTSASSTSTTSRRTAATPCCVLDADRVPRARERHGARRQHVLLGVARDADDRRPWTSPIPSLPLPIWFGNYDSHGLSISDDGNRAYVAGIRLRADHPRHLRDPGPRPEPERAARSRASVGLDEHPAERDPDHHRGPSLPGRDRRVRRPVRGGRGPHHRHRRRAQPAGGLQPAPRGAPARELRRVRPTTRAPEPGAGLRGPLLQRADSATTPGSSPAA